MRRMCERGWPGCRAFPSLGLAARWGGEGLSLCRASRHARYQTDTLGTDTGSGPEGGQAQSGGWLGGRTRRESRLVMLC